MMRVVPLLIVAVLLLHPLPARACAEFVGSDGLVWMNKEEVLIIWDPATGMEHFIRKADFSVRAKDFGFLVPTPSQPNITEASDAVFPQLNALFPAPPPMRGERGIGGAVTVLEQKRVGSMDVAVLQATDGEALMGWLSANGYKQDASHKDWLDYCTKQGMTVSAFKYAGAENQGTLKSAFNMAKNWLMSGSKYEPNLVTADTVCLSFRTDYPFFPYHEPTYRGYGSRKLELYVIAPEPVTAVRGEFNEGYAGNHYRESISIEQEVLRDVLPARMLPRYNPVITRFNDYSTQRAPGDLYFVSAPKAGE